ncbi:hypothetical protein Pfo_000934 [Paulownia fortunei]|nr:hypothetical protein Pfo_000934 [Paulownia fortunei]
MSTNTQRVLIIQDASRALCIISVRHVLSGLSLRCGDKIRLLGIIQAFTKTNRLYPKGCGSFIKHKTKLHSSATINKHKEDIKEETQKTLERYANCAETKEILKIAETSQVEFEIAVEAGLLKEVAVEYAKSFQATHVILHRRPWIGLKKKFTYAELQLATNGFCPQNLMSDHGRKIYLGLLNDQRKTLIRENPSGTIKEEEFKREVQILEAVRHENVALLLGSCSEGPHRFLVYEYVCNGSLNKHLSNKSRKLTWEKRISIAHGAAKGLEYLHGERIYGSMRPSNILITHDYQPLARPLLRQKKYMELIDPVVQDSVDLYQLYWLIRVADKCLSWDPKSRYSMKKGSQVVVGNKQAAFQNSDFSFSHFQFKAAVMTDHVNYSSIASEAGNDS